MITISLSNWNEFEEWIAEIFGSIRSAKDATGRYVSDILFRGQNDATWKLATTLERYAPYLTDVVDYYYKIHAAKHQIEAHTSHSWDIPEPMKYREEVENKDFGFFTLPAYEYLVHLRHFGFPSPLLDWTRSPYIASFFAFSECKESESSRIAIFAYQEYTGHAKSGWVGDITINSHGPSIRSHKRHFIQQSEYTTCMKIVGERWHYADHESALSKDNKDQDIFWKITLPSSERLKVLQLLDRHNLNEYSLFGSEESLMKTVALRELYFRGNDFT